LREYACRYFSEIQYVFNRRFDLKLGLLRLIRVAQFAVLWFASCVRLKKYYPRKFEPAATAGAPNGIPTGCLRRDHVIG